MSNGYGYVKLYRKITNSFVWTNPNMLKLWMLCLMKASHSGNKFLFNGKEIVVDSGEFVTGRDVITKEMNEGATNEHQVNKTSVWRWLKKFESEGMLDIKSNTKYSVISIKNWQEYQVSEQQVDNKRITSEQQVDTIKNAKNAKNAKNKDTPQKSKKRIYENDSIYYKLALKLFNNIRLNNQEYKEPNLQGWSDDIRKMVELDKRDIEKVDKMIYWSQNNSFWSGVVLSANSLRKNYDKMTIQANKEYTERSQNKEPIAKNAALDEFAKKMEAGTNGL